MTYRVLDLFSAAAGGWSLGMHRAGFETVAACEIEEWRRVLYSENNPGVRLYEDVKGLTADRLRGDLGYLPDIVVGSPPCQDISSANAMGKGVDGERSGLFFEAIRIAGEIKARGGARWVALENSANLRTKGSDRVLGALEDHGYACWPLVVRARDVGANHQRARVWIIGFAVDQLIDTQEVGREGRRPWGHWPERDGQASASGRNPAQDGRSEGRAGRRAPTDAWVREHPHFEVVGGDVYSCGSSGTRPQWNGGLAGHLRVDDGLSAWVAGARVAVGGPRGTAAAALLVEAFGDAVVPQIPEAIGRAILRTEAALAAIYGRGAA